MITKKKILALTKSTDCHLSSNVGPLEATNDKRNCFGENFLLN